MEKKALKWLVAKLDNRRSRTLSNNWFLLSIWSVLVVAIASLLRLAEKGVISDFVLVLVSVGLGVLVGMFYIFRESEKNLPYILPHLSRESIEKRINEIET